MIKTSHFIFYVADQVKSAEFYSSVLGIPPRLNVPGMTEFEIAPSVILGLMPSTGIKRLLGSAIRSPEEASGIPRAEIYLVVDDPELFHRRALGCGGVELSSLAQRSWGHWAAYSADPDGHVLAFARESENIR